VWLDCKHKYSLLAINPLNPKGNYSATSNNTKLLHWPLIGVCILVHLEGPRRSAAPPSPLLTVPNVTAHPSTASVPITILLYDGPLLCSFSVAIQGLSRPPQKWQLYATATFICLSVCLFVCLWPATLRPRPQSVGRWVSHIFSHPWKTPP